ncbi:hypothetical protein [Acinetobacter variabilis]|uniref:hypothetical protein n=1 Tax=Acinetobacter variabilis TaxID=70346 RepID=UPI0030FCEB29
MNNIVDFYSEREVIFIDSEEFSDLSSLPDYQFRNLVVIGGSGQGKDIRLDFGSLCYSKRTNILRNIKSCKVVESTLDETLEKVFDLYVKSKLSNCARTSVHFFRDQLKKFSDYYFDNLNHLDFDDYKACCLAYEQYTQKLLLKKAELLSSSETANFDQLSFNQIVFAELICLYHNKDLKKFKEISVVISRAKESTKIETVSLNELSCFYDFNKKLFYALADFLMENRPYPFIFSDSQQEKSQIVHYPIDGFFQTMRQKLFKKDGFLVNRSELQEIINSINEPFGKVSVEGHKLYLESLYNRFIENLGQSNQEKLLDKARLINYAVAAFTMCLYCESSINSSLAYKVKLEDLTNFQVSTKGVRLYVIKPRAGYKQIELLIAVPMLPLIETYKKFRLWALSLTDKKNIPNLLFSLSTKLGETDNPFKSVNSFSGCQIGNYKRWLLGFIPHFIWITPTTIRKSTSTIFYNESKSVVVASKKLGNTPMVVGRHYIEATEDEFTEQVSNFFDAVHNEIANKYRKNNEILTVLINEDSEETPMGGCKKLVPKLHEGFTDELEKPHCSNPSSCLFCENYVVHSDREDIRKLLSLKKILSISDKYEETLVITKRINEILKILYEKYPETRDDFITIAQSVERGEFDEYWQDHLNLLLELGVNFYG